MTVGENIRTLRVAQGMTQEELGDALGVKKSTIQKYENGTIKNLNAATIRDLVGVFHVFPRFFIFDSDDDYWRKLIGVQNPDNLQKLEEDGFNYIYNAQFDVSSVEGYQHITESLYKHLGINVTSVLFSFTRLNRDGKMRAIQYINDLMKIDELKSGE